MFMISIYLSHKVLYLYFISLEGLAYAQEEHGQYVDFMIRLTVLRSTRGLLHST